MFGRLTGNTQKTTGFIYKDKIVVLVNDIKRPVRRIVDEGLDEPILY